MGLVARSGLLVLSAEDGGILAEPALAYLFWTGGELDVRRIKWHRVLHFSNCRSRKKEKGKRKKEKGKRKKEKGNVCVIGGKSEE